MFKGCISGSPPTPKEKQQSRRMLPRDLTQSKETRRHSISPAAPDALLPSLETINVPATGSSNGSSAQTFLFGSTEETENISPMSNQENCDIASQQKNDGSTVFDLTTPLTDLENDIILFVCSPQCLLLQLC
jgi:hypothetical protein